MHTRKTVAAGALALVLTACGGQGAGPTPTVGSGQAAGPDVLAIKLDALTTDQCFLNPARQTPRGCQKFITELASTSGMVRAQNGLAARADDLDKGIGSYRSAHCDTVADPGNPCTRALLDIAATLTTIKQHVEGQVTGH